MASGQVAKKIALFEVKQVPTLEQQCRLKRKHAIRRKKYRGKERRIVTHEGISMLALSNSDEHLNHIKDSDEDGSSTSSRGNYPYCSKFSASCSALFDLVSVADSTDFGGTTLEEKTTMEIIPLSKKLILKSKSGGIGEPFSKRLNIIDIDIEIKIEQKSPDPLQESPSFVEVLTTKDTEEYEPLLSEKGPTPVLSVTTDRIRLKASVDDSQVDKSVNYYCSKCSHETPALSRSQPIKTDNYKLDKNTKPPRDNKSVYSPGSGEPLYENVFTHVPPPPVSLGAPPLPPKRLFGDTFTTNYSCLPTLYSKDKSKGVNENKSVSNPTDSAKKDKAYSVYKSQLTDRDNEESKSKASSAPIKIETLEIHNTNSSATAIPAPVSITNDKDIIDESVTDSVLLSRGVEAKTTAANNATSLLERLCRNESLEGDAKNHGNVEEDEEDDDDDEPFYEDLYDYCNGSENGTGEIPSHLNPLLELFRDQLNSLEQNAEDEVEYCDCSTIMTLMDPETKTETEPEDQNQNDMVSYEIYDDCFGLEMTNQDQNESANWEDNSKNMKRPVAQDDIGSVTKCGANILGDYIKSKVTKASTPFSSRKNSTSSEQIQQSTSTSSYLYPSLLSMFPSLSKAKLVEPKGATVQNIIEINEEYAKNQASSSSSSSYAPTPAQVIAENERNVRETKNASANTTSLFYGLYNNGSNQHHNGVSNNKPRFGGRPVIAHHHHHHPGQQNDDDDTKTLSSTTKKLQSGVDAHKRDKSDDNEIFNKPLPLPPTTSSQYESVYEEPLYGITNQLTATYSDNGKPMPVPMPPPAQAPGQRRSSAPAGPYISNKFLNSNNSSKPPSNYSHSPSVSSGSTYGYSSGSVNDYGESKYGPSSCQTTGSSTGQPNTEAMSIYGMSDKLPPTPPSKFSSIAKTAGRKIAKKFLGYRKNSKVGLEDTSLSPFSSVSGVDSAIGSGASSPLHSVTSQESHGPGSMNGSASVTPTNSSGAKVSSSSNTSNGAPIRRPISRPSIPPPEPPKNEETDGNPTTPLPSQHQHPPDLPIKNQNNYSIYDRKNDDDYEDSDFYDSDSELIRNFVSQVQPIYSMEEEPLYQYYTYGISLKPDDDYQPVIPKNLGLTLDMLVPRVGQRTLWCELPGVVSSGILSILSDKQKQLQEAIFEILTSEVSYLKSLDVLIALFYKNEELVGVVTEEERGYLFGNIEDVRDCSQAFLSELLGKWEESWYIQEIGEIISRNSNTRFSVYKEYCRNKPFQDKTMMRLRNSRDEFVTVVKAIEEDEKCQMLQIDSFLMLPMQRITRLPLLVNAVIQRTPAGKEKIKCEEALKCLTNLVLACNDAARESQDAEETMAILEKLEFTKGIKALPDLGQFIIKGDFMKNPFDQGRSNQLNWTFRKLKRTFYWLFLFSKQLLVTRRKTNGRFEIIDMIDPLNSNIKALPNLEGVSKDYKHFFMLHFNHNPTIYFLAARTSSEVERWKSKLDGMKPKEELRVEAIFPYDARRPDEMSFYVGDVIRVSQIQPDGWYFGTKLATGESGWFPGNYCCENSP